jgi:hypothetical protein
VTKLSKFLVAFCVLLILWALYAAHREAKLTATYQADKKADQLKIDVAQAQIKTDEATRNNAAVTYQKQYAALEQVKQRTVTVKQIVHELASDPTIKDAPVIVTDKQANALAALPDAPPIHAGDVCLSAADMKPLYDARVTGQECAANVANLIVQNATLIDEGKQKDTQIAADNDKVKQAEIVIKGGTRWKRLRHDTFVAAIGGVITAGAIEYVKHK